MSKVPHGSDGRFLPGPSAPIEARFWALVEKNGPTMPGMSTPCWVWTGVTQRSGHGRFHVGSIKDNSSRLVSAHRQAFFLHHGRWPEPCALHRCDNPACVRWDHMFEGTNEENSRDRRAKGRDWQLSLTHCPQGHPYAGGNLVIGKTDNGGTSRACRECRRKRDRARPDRHIQPRRQVRS